MKILLVTWSCDRLDVSETHLAYRWVNEIAKRHDVILFSVSRPDRFGCVKEQFPNLLVYEWCDIRVPDFMERFRAVVKPGYFFYFRKARNFLRQLIQDNKFDLIHHLNPFAWRYASPAYGLGVPLVRGPLAGGLLTPEPLSKEVREMFHPYKFLRKTDKLRKYYDRTLIDSYRQTDIVLGSSPYVADLIKPLIIKRFEVESEFGFDSIPCLDSLRINSNISNKIQLLFVGRIIRTKGIRDAIRAVSYMKNRHKIAFKIIGSGDDLQDCQSLVRKLRLEDSVTFLGWCSKKQVEQAYCNADIFIFPSFREPTGGVLLEAMAYGLPCVTCDYGGPAYIVGDGCGFKIPPTEPESFARNIATQLDLLVDNEKLRLKMSKKAVRHIANNFNWESKMARIDAIYNSLVGS